MINIQELRAKNEVERVKILMNLRVVDMKSILKNENIKRVYKMKKDELQNEILQLVYLEQLEFNIEPVAAPEEPEIDEVLPAIIEEQELISQDKFKEILNFIMFDDLGGLEVLKSEGFKVGYENVEEQLESLICCDVFPEIFAINKKEGLYNAAAYNELLCKMLNMAEVTGNKALKEIANYGFTFIAKEIEAFKKFDENNPPF